MTKTELWAAIDRKAKAERAKASLRRRVSWMWMDVQWTFRRRVSDVSLAVNMAWNAWLYSHLLPTLDAKLPEGSRIRHHAIAFAISLYR